MRFLPVVALMLSATASLSFAEPTGGEERSEHGAWLSPPQQCIAGTRCPVPLVPSRHTLQPIVPPVPASPVPIEVDCRELPNRVERDHCVTLKLHVG